MPMKSIPLSGRKGAGKFALVSDVDFAALSQFKWYLGTGGYAIRTFRSASGKEGSLAMHRQVAGCDHGLDAVPRNGDRLDCRRSNLRIGSRSETLHHATRPYATNRTSGLLGCHKSKGRFRARISVNGVRVSLGLYATAAEAKAAYDAANVRAYGTIPKERIAGDKV